MVKIKWIITDHIKDVELKDFDTKWDGIFGYFQICINKHFLGFCPDRELLPDEEGNENILYWLTKLSEGSIRLNTDQEYEIQLLSMNLAKILLRKNGKVLISFINTNTNEVKWSEKVIIQEWYDEVILNLGRFIIEVQKDNAVLLDSNLMRKLIKIKGMLV